jgi:hypothetical protein
MADDMKKGTETKTVGNITTQAQSPCPLPTVDIDQIGRGTSDFVPGYPTRQSYTLEEVQSKKHG